MTSKYPRTPCWPWSPSFPKGDRTNREPGLFIHTEVIITEKIDGACTAPWMAMVRKHHAWKTAGMEGILYGEDIYGVHSIPYEPIREQDTFRAFALLQDGIFQSWDRLAEIAADLEVSTVPVLFRGKFESVSELDRFIQEAHRQPSAIGPEREGIVVRTAGAFPQEEFHRNMAKSVRVNHVQTREHWTRNWRPCGLSRE